MKKIILLFDTTNLKSETMDFVAAIAKPGKSKIFGVMLEHHDLDTIPSVKTMGGQIYVEEITEDQAEHEIKKDLAEKNIRLFKDGCALREVSAQVHKYGGNVIENVIEESRYADLIILGPSTTFNNDKSTPSKFTLELLTKSECPILIAPGYFEQPNEVVFAYDGSKSSMFALKQFYYLLPQFADEKLVVLHVSDFDKSSRIDKREQQIFNEWLEMKFSNIFYEELTGAARDALFTYFFEQENYFNKMLVTGAYGRSILSSFFKPSTADLLLKAVDIPMFITHR